MAKRRTTYGKLQRERTKKEKAAAKAERRAARAEDVDETTDGRAPNEAAVIAELEALHERYDAGALSLEDFEARRNDLLSRLTIG
jgi:hypothetical protein